MVLMPFQHSKILILEASSSVICAVLAASLKSDLYLSGNWNAEACWRCDPAPWWLPEFRSFLGPIRNITPAQRNKFGALVDFALLLLACKVPRSAYHRKPLWPRTTSNRFLEAFRISKHLVADYTQLHLSCGSWFPYRSNRWGWGFARSPRRTFSAMFTTALP